MLLATTATESPITIITGPITTGGSNRLTIGSPKYLINAANTKYIKPAANSPNIVPPMPHSCMA